MPEAVIVATARSPIGRAFKGSLTTIRPDDAVRQMVVAALAKVPQLDSADIGDLMLGCGLPGGEQGFNMARVVAIMLGYDHLRPRAAPAQLLGDPAQPHQRGVPNKLDQRSVDLHHQLPPLRRRGRLRPHHRSGRRLI